MDLVTANKIRQEYLTDNRVGRLSELAAKYGISTSMASKIVNHRIYPDNSAREKSIASSGDQLERLLLVRRLKNEGIINSATVAKAIAELENKTEPVSERTVRRSFELLQKVEAVLKGNK